MRGLSGKEALVALLVAQHAKLSRQCLVAKQLIGLSTCLLLELSLSLTEAARCVASR